MASTDIVFKRLNYNVASEGILWIIDIFSLHTPGWNSLGGDSLGNTLYKTIVIQADWAALIFTSAWVSFKNTI